MLIVDNSEHDNWVKFIFHLCTEKAFKGDSSANKSLKDFKISINILLLVLKGKQTCTAVT